MRDKSWRQRNYIDLFSGPGKCIVRGTDECLLGSPLLALVTQYPFTDYYFSDLDQQNIDALCTRSTKSSIPRDHIRCLTGDANEIVKNVVHEIEQVDKVFLQGVGSCLNLAVLDPEGLELAWATVEALGKMRTMDLIIHYSQNGLTRNVDKYVDSNEDSVIDRFFGGRDWRDVYKKTLLRKGPSGVHRVLIDHYKSKLAKLGYVAINDRQQTVAEPLIRNTEKNAPLYRLIFASKHSLGNRIWNEVTKKDYYGQAKLL